MNARRSNSQTRAFAGLVAALLSAAVATSARADTPPSGPTDVVLLWQGFRHYWERETLFGFHLPHRVSRFASGVAPGVSVRLPDGLHTTTSFRFAQSPGVDGDWMVPEGYVARVSAPGLAAWTGVATMSGVDTIDDGPHPAALRRFDRILTIEVPPSDRPRTVTAVLQGLSFRSTCLDGAALCNSDGIWPYRFHLQLAACSDLGTTLVCPLSVEVGRAWTPGQGGVRPLARKPLNTRMGIEVEVAWAVLVAPESTLLAHPLTFENALPSTRDIVFGDQTVRVPGLPTGYDRVAVGLTGLGFEFFPVAQRESRQNRGRYIGGWGVRAETKAWDPSTGTLDIVHAGGIWLPRTVKRTGVQVEVGMTLLQVAGEGASVEEGITARGRLCAESVGAPFFSAWSRCAEAAGIPPRTEETVPLGVPPAPSP